MHALLPCRGCGKISSRVRKNYLLIKSTDRAPEQRSLAGAGELIKFKSKIRRLSNQ